MANRIWNTVSLVVALSAPLTIAAPLAAQTAACQPGDIVCGEVQVGPIDGRFRIGFGQDAPPPPPPVVYQPPPPPVVYVQPPPLVVYEPPPVVYQPPPVVYQPPPQQVVYQQQVPQPQLVQRRVRYQLVPRFDIGLNINVGAMATDRVGIGGGGLALRIRPIEWFAIDLGIRAYAGQSYGGADHWEVPVLANLLFFFNPGDRFQVYGILGAGVSFGQDGRALSSPIGGRPGAFVGSRDLFYVGGEVGLGLEWRIARHFAMNIDARAFMREQIGGAPEFTESTSGGGTRSTNTSAGGYGNLGMTFYFIGL